MLTFCTDVDLLHWEPNLFSEAGFASQTLLSGAGDLVGTTFTLTSAGSFLDSHIEADHVIALTGGTSGCYPIVSVDSATQLTLSVLYDRLFPASGLPEPSPPGSAAGLACAIRTFWPQRRVVSELLLQSAGVNPSAVSADPGLLLNPQTLQRACVLGTLNMVYSALAAVASEPGPYTLRADLYERLYRRALQTARVELDTDHDGAVNVTRALNIVPFQHI